MAHIIMFVLLVMTNLSNALISFTFPCGLDICRFPGQYCDQSDEDRFRCDVCDLEIVCKESDTPEQCKPLCEVPNEDPGHQDWPDQFFYRGKGSVTVYFILMFLFGVLFVVFLVLWIVGRYYKRQTSAYTVEQDRARIQHPTDDQNDRNSLAPNGQPTDDQNHLEQQTRVKSESTIP